MTLKVNYADHVYLEKTDELVLLGDERDYDKYFIIDKELDARNLINTLKYAVEQGWWE